MKKFLYALISVFILIFTSDSVKAQAWDKSTKVLALGVGGSQFFHILPNNSRYYGGYSLPLTGQLNFQGEFGVHDYVGIGFTTGIGGRAGYGWGGRYGYYSTGEFNVPIGLIANFHFYQLISDKTGKDIHADKLDVYGGINVGSGIAVLYGGGGQVVPIAFGGVQAGVRYYFTESFGVNGEIGWGKSWINAGLVFKL